VRDFPYPASVDWPVDAVTHFVSHYGLWVVLALVLVETAGGPFLLALLGAQFLRRRLLGA
jgi:hypothetical protein